MNPEVLTSATMVKARTRPTAKVSVQRTTQVDRETIAAYGALITALLNNAELLAPANEGRDGTEPVMPS